MQQLGERILESCAALPDGQLSAEVEADAHRNAATVFRQAVEAYQKVLPSPSTCHICILHSVCSDDMCISAKRKEAGGLFSGQIQPYMPQQSYSCEQCKTERGMIRMAMVHSSAVDPPEARDQ